MCDEGRYGYHYVNSAERFVRPQSCRSTAAAARRRGRRSRRNSKQEFADAAQANATGVVAVLSPFLTVEEAFLLATYFKGLSNDVRLALGPVPVVGEDDTLPEGREGQPGRADDVHDPRREVPEPPRRRGGAEALPGVGDPVRGRGAARRSTRCGSPAATRTRNTSTRGHADRLEAAGAARRRRTSSRRVLTAAATYVLPATTSFEKDGTFVNHAGLAQTFAARGPPAGEARTELQLASTCSAAAGWCRPRRSARSWRGRCP